MPYTTIACARYLAFWLPNYVLRCAKRSTSNNAILSLWNGKSNGVVDCIDCISSISSVDFILTPKAGGGIVAVLAAVGIYGVMANIVAQRTHEIGIRMRLEQVPVTC